MYRYYIMKWTKAYEEFKRPDGIVRMTSREIDVFWRLVLNRQKSDEELSDYELNLLDAFQGLYDHIEDVRTSFFRYVLVTNITVLVLAGVFAIWQLL